MLDGKQWTTDNLRVNANGSYCYDDAELNCRQYGRLYTWASAQQGCQSLGAGWRLPTEDEWRRLAKNYGGVHKDSADGGKAAYKALMIGTVRASMPCQVAIEVPMTVSTDDWKLTDSIGQHPKLISTVHSSTTLVTRALTLSST